MIIVSICIASYFFEMAINEDIKNILHSIAKTSKTDGNCSNIFAQFTEFIELHSAAKQLSI